jgi:hypothetical protein
MHDLHPESGVDWKRCAAVVVIQMCYVGPKEKGSEYLQAISKRDDHFFPRLFDIIRT